MFLDGFVSNVDIDIFYSLSFFINVNSKYSFYLNKCLFVFWTCFFIYGSWLLLETLTPQFSQFHWFAFCAFLCGFLKCHWLWIGVHTTSNNQGTTKSQRINPISLILFSDSVDHHAIKNNYLHLSLILSEWILRWDCFFWILLSVLKLSEWILWWDCFVLNILIMMTFLISFLWFLLSVLNFASIYCD